MTTSIYTIYKITNTINSKIYIGAHEEKSEYEELYEYMGSGTYIKRSIKKYGVGNFTKEIIYRFGTEKEMYDKEEELVNQKFIERTDTYNIRIGGHGGIKHIAKNMTVAKDTNGNLYHISNKDNRLGKTLFGIQKNMVSVIDYDGNNISVSIDDSRYQSGELVSILKDKVISKDKNGRNIKIDKDDPRFLNGELVGVAKGTITVVDKDGKTSRVSNDDPRWLSGELVGTTKGTLKGTDNPKFSGYWIYKDDKFSSLDDISDFVNSSPSAIIRWCKKQNNKKINKFIIGQSKFLQSLGTKEDIIGKSFKEIGFGFEPINQNTQMI